LVERPLRSNPFEGPVLSKFLCDLVAEIDRDDWQGARALFDSREYA
jgi:hypothetical protein